MRNRIFNSYKYDQQYKKYHRRTKQEKSISKDASCQYFNTTLPTIERMPETTLNEIVDKYVEMNIAHPFMEGNGRSARLWLDLMLKRSLKKCVDWSKISKNDYLNAMRISPVDSIGIKALIIRIITRRMNEIYHLPFAVEYEMVNGNCK
jgi:fido (protein-threonine AMPylation protein)